AAARHRPQPRPVTHAAGLTVAGALLAAAVMLGTVVARIVPRGGPRRALEEAAIILGFATPAIALLPTFLRHHLWAPAADTAAWPSACATSRTEPGRGGSAHAVDRVALPADDLDDLVRVALVARLQDQLDARLGHRHVDALAVVGHDQDVDVGVGEDLEQGHQ